MWLRGRRAIEGRVEGHGLLAEHVYKDILAKAVSRPVG